MLVALALIISALCSLSLVYTLVGYPVAANLTARLLNHRHPSPPTAHDHNPDPEPRLSLVICVKNEEANITQRINNLLRCRSPHPLEIIVVCDGCSDSTAKLARAAGASLVIERSSECGKAACLNAGVAAAAHELVVFADARQSFDHKALVHLARAFAAPEIGAVGGALEIEGARRRTVGRALDHYWTTEKMLRRAESEIDSTIGCTGAIYAIRRRLYTPIPEDTILDDVLIPMQIALQGYRVVFQPDAIAFDPQPLGGKREQSRKHRTLAGNFQLLFRYPAWLLPWRNRLVIQLVSHKYSRLSTPLLITLIIASNAALASTSIWASLSLSACLALLAIGAAGLVAPRLNESSRIVFLASSFLFLQIAICRSLFYYLNWACERKTAWR